MSSNDDLDGYVTEVEYPSNLVQQMTPAWIAAVAAWHGIRPPDLDRPFRMLDIGCGAGLALTLAAAAHPAGEFAGLDGMASHIARGLDFADGVPNIRLAHQTFGAALSEARADCDIVTAHGVLSWVGARPRAAALQLAAARVRPGGLFAASYNAYPGAARQLAVQHLIRRLTAEMEGPPAARYERAFARVREMSERGFGAVQPAVIRRLEELARDAPPEYFVHEYMHAGWSPLWPDEVHRPLAEAGLEYIGQADFLRQRLDLAVTPRQRPVIDAAPPGLGDMLVDMATDAPFRIDLFARDPVRATADPRLDIWLGAEAAPGDILTVLTPGGEARLDEALACAVLERLEDGPRPVRELLSTAEAGRVRDVLECLMIGDRVIPLAPPRPSGPAARLNSRLCRAARDGPDIPIAALAGAGGPVPADAVQMGVLGLSDEAMLARASRDPSFRDRFIHPEIDLADQQARRRVAGGLADLRARYRRLGVVVDDHGPEPGPAA